MAEYKSAYTGQEIDAGIADVSNKQDTLVSGTNIKTINNQSILGSGNLEIGGSGGTSDYDQLSNRPSINNNTLTGNKTSSQLGLQEELVSGTNIKTINNTSILGSGNINIEGSGSGISTDDSNSPFEIADEDGNVILRIDNAGNINTMSFSSGTSVPRIPTTSVAGKYLTSTDTEGTVEWTSSSNSKVLKVPFIKDQHRGWSSATVHENTLPAFKRAWLNGADMVELDARLSADNIYICAHDATITVDGTTYTVAETNADVLTNLVLSTDATYGFCKVPLTETILKFCAHAGMLCNLDCKSINTRTIAELVNKCGMSGKVMYANVASPSAALEILNYDKHAMFLFNYSSLSSWVTAFENNKEVLERSWCWSYASVNLAEPIATARAAGVKFLVAGISSYNATIFALQPDGFEFTEPTDCQAVCDQYLESLNF